MGTSFEEAVGELDDAGMVVNETNGHNEKTSGLAEFFPWRKTSTASKDECCICLERYAPAESICVPISEGCPHVFHEKCIVEWLKTHGECPLCSVKLLSD